MAPNSQTYGAVLLGGLIAMLSVFSRGRSAASLTDLLRAVFRELSLLKYICIDEAIHKIEGGIK